jgi:hypothetical protein
MVHAHKAAAGTDVRTLAGVSTGSASNDVHERGPIESGARMLKIWSDAGAESYVGHGEEYRLDHAVSPVNRITPGQGE